MRDTANSQYDSFLFWRMPIPELDLSELELLGLADMAAFKPKGDFGAAQSCASPPGEVDDDDDGLLQFSSFNFWRAPVARISPIDFDLI